MARGAARGAVGALAASVLALAFQVDRPPHRRHRDDGPVHGGDHGRRPGPAARALRPRGGGRPLRLAGSGRGRRAQGARQRPGRADRRPRPEHGGRRDPLHPRARDLRALRQARGDAPAAPRLAGAAAAMYEPRVRRVRARLRPHRALLHDHRGAEPDAPARDGATRAADRRRDGARRRLRDRRPRRHDVRALAAAQRRLRGSCSPRATAGTCAP